MQRDSFNGRGALSLGTAILGRRQLVALLLGAAMLACSDATEPDSAGPVGREVAKPSLMLIADPCYNDIRNPCHGVPFYMGGGYWGGPDVTYYSFYQTTSGSMYYDCPMDVPPILSTSTERLESVPRSIPSSPTANGRRSTSSQ